MPDNPSSDNGTKLIPPKAAFAGKAHCPSFEKYEEMYQRSIEDPDGFWGEIADTFVWEKKWDQVCDYSFEGDVTSSGLSTARPTCRSTHSTAIWRRVAIRSPLSGKATNRANSPN